MKVNDRWLIRIELPEMSFSFIMKTKAVSMAMVDAGMIEVACAYKITRLEEEFFEALAPRIDAVLLEAWDKVFEGQKHFGDMTVTASKIPYVR